MTKIKAARIATATAAILLVVSGLVGKLSYEGICTLGAEGIWATCPLGFLERSLAAREIVPQWTSVGLVVILVILLGRVFCAWICPSVLLRRIFGAKAPVRPRQGSDLRVSRWAAYSPYAVLVGVLVASFVFRFPVFCLFCPVGVFFGWVYAVIRLLSPDSFSAELVVFPLILGIELWGLKSWCRSICPLGALLSLLGNLNFFFLPSVSKERCLAAKDVNCGACGRVCQEGSDLVSLGSRFLPNSCTKCLECYERCPAKAIEIAILK